LAANRFRAVPRPEATESLAKTLKSRTANRVDQGERITKETTAAIANDHKRAKLPPVTLNRLWLAADQITGSGPVVGRTKHVVLLGFPSPIASCRARCSGSMNFVVGAHLPEVLALV
jgi:hypothetical protein